MRKIKSLRKVAEKRRRKGQHAKGNRVKKVGKFKFETGRWEQMGMPGQRQEGKIRGVEGKYQCLSGWRKKGRKERDKRGESGKDVGRGDKRKEWERMGMQQLQLSRLLLGFIHFNPECQEFV